jgi:hypothetical protein
MVAALWLQIEVWRSGIHIILVDAAGSLVAVVYFLTAIVLVEFPKPVHLTALPFIGINAIDPIFGVIVNAAGMIVRALHIAVVRTDEAVIMLKFIEMFNFSSQTEETLCQLV